MTAIATTRRAASRRRRARATRRQASAGSRSAARSCSRSSASFILLTVLFPILWIFSLALDPRNLSRPDGLT